MVRVFRADCPWLGRAERHEGIEVFRRAEGVYITPESWLAIKRSALESDQKPHDVMVGLVRDGLEGIVSATLTSTVECWPRLAGGRGLELLEKVSAKRPVPDRTLYDSESTSADDAEAGLAEAAGAAPRF